MASDVGRSSSGGDSGGDDNNFLRSVVVVYATRIEPDFASPWHKEEPCQTQGSGFIIADPRAPEDARLVVTNAHVVDYASEVFVKRYHGEERVRAKVLRLVTDCDVAVLVVDEEGFWDDEGEGGKVPCLSFGKMPKIQDVVRVVGYPEHGTEIAVTSGSVSRIQHQEYVHSEMELLSLQTTALIAYGNSGGPVLNVAGEVVGIAFQGTDRVGEFIPVCVFARFLEVDEDTEMGEIQSVAGLSFTWQKLENKAIRSSLGLDVLDGNNRSGILVTSVDEFGAVAGVLQNDDVVVEVEGVNVGNQGSIIVEGNRIQFMHLVTSRAVGDTLHVGIVREGKRLDVEWKLASGDLSHLVPKYDRLKMKGLLPDYMVIGGLVLCSFSKQLYNCLHGSGCFMFSLCNSLGFDKKSTVDDEYVVISRLLPNKVVEGYASYEVESRRVDKLNGEKVRSLRHFAELYAAATGKYLNLDLNIPCFPTTSKIVLDRELIASEQKAILEEYQIPKWARLEGSVEEGSVASSGSASEDSDVEDNKVGQKAADCGVS